MTTSTSMKTSASDDDAKVPVTIYSDVICPWCYVGKRRFEAGTRALGLQDRFAITWKPFELNPDMPAGGMERAAYRERKFGAEKAAAYDRQLEATGRESGIPFAFDRMARTPNTRLAHRLIWQAGELGSDVQNALVDRLFKAYFEDARDIGRIDVLQDLAIRAGVASDTARTALEDDTSLDAVLDLEDAGLQMGIQGVPYFILIGKYAISGAQPPELWQQALPQIVAEAGQPS